MSSWKRLAQKNRCHNTSYSSNKHQRYTPKKIATDEMKSYRFHNYTIEKMSQSQMSQSKDKQKDRSMIDKPVEVMQPRILKANSSQIKMKQLLNQHKYSVTSGSFIMNLPDDPQQKIRRSNTIVVTKKSQKNALFEQIQKLKRQFTMFKHIILNQLQKKQKYLIELLQGILQKINQVKNQKQVKIQKQGKNKYQSATLINSSYCSDKSYSFHKKFIDENQFIGMKLSNQVHKVLSTISKPSFDEVSSQRMKKKSFNKFFEAVENLKKDIKDLNQISDVSFISSPNNSNSRNQWKSWSRFAKI